MERLPVLVRADALVYDATCNREVAAAMRTRAAHFRELAAMLRDDNRALRAQAAQVRRRATLTRAGRRR
jgi:hypothetical protein